uniref:Uncharacterized protein n=1 Tax=Trichogramma kaykai TaxID=54128 RepID=A0ABD2XFD7_9HYME
MVEKRLQVQRSSPSAFVFIYNCGLRDSMPFCVLWSAAYFKAGAPSPILGRDLVSCVALLAASPSPRRRSPLRYCSYE